MTSLHKLLVGSSLCRLSAISLAAILAAGGAVGTWASETRAAEAIVASADGKSADKNAVSPAAPSVEMFAAMQSGDLEVKFIPKNDREALVKITNKTKRPLSVKLPEAFAAVPVLAQAAGGRNRAGGNAPGGMMNQGMGGGMGGMGMGGMGMGGMGGGGMGGMGGGGMFNVAPEAVGQFNVAPQQVRQFKVATVCLEHGKKDPRPAVPYEIHPIESFTTKPGVAELCAQLGYGNIDQRAAQVAAWHLNSGLSWDQLAAKRIEHLNGESEPYFSADQMQMGLAASNAAEATAAESAANGSKSKSAPEKPTTPVSASASKR